jgi:hypothetical protein
MKMKIFAIQGKMNPAENVQENLGGGHVYDCAVVT